MPLPKEYDKPTVAPPDEPSSAQSLQLKLSRRGQKSPQTSQSTYSGDTPLGLVTRRSSTTETAQEDEPGQVARVRDILDDMIDEARAVMHLVRTDRGVVLQLRIFC